MYSEWSPATCSPNSWGYCCEDFMSFAPLLKHSPENRSIMNHICWIYIVCWSNHTNYIALCSQIVTTSFSRNIQQHHPTNTLMVTQDMKYFNALFLKGKTLDNITKKTTKGPSQIFSHWSWRLWLSPWPSFPFPPCPWAFVSPLQTLVCSGVAPKSWAASESQPKVWPVEYCNHRVF